MVHQVFIHPHNTLNDYKLESLKIVLAPGIPQRKPTDPSIIRIFLSVAILAKQAAWSGYTFQIRKKGPTSSRATFRRVTGP